jgi:hypothetical protein
MSKRSDAPTPAHVAKVRRSGATWNKTREHFGLKWSSGKFTELLNGGGYDAGGAKLDGSGPESKARYRRKG